MSSIQAALEAQKKMFAAKATQPPPPPQQEFVDPAITLAIAKAKAAALMTCSSDSGGGGGGESGPSALDNAKALLSSTANFPQAVLPKSSLPGLQPMMGLGGGLSVPRPAGLQQPLRPPCLSGLGGGFVPGVVPPLSRPCGGMMGCGPMSVPGKASLPTPRMVGGLAQGGVRPMGALSGCGFPPGLVPPVTSKASLGSMMGPQGSFNLGATAKLGSIGPPGLGFGGLVGNSFSAPGPSLAGFEGMKEVSPALAALMQGS